MRSFLPMIPATDLALRDFGVWCIFQVLIKPLNLRALASGVKFSADVS